MAERAVLQLPGSSAVARRVQQHTRRQLRIAIRQLERAELYLDAVESLDLDDPETDRSVRQITEQIRGLRRYLSARRAGA
jgi:hypothetical protein